MAQALRIRIRFIEEILDAYGYCTADHDFERIHAIIADCHSALSEDKSPEWLYLQTRLPILQKIEDFEQLETKHNELVKQSSDLGYPIAQYHHACRLYESGRHKEAAELYKLAADQGDPAAQYCYGLDLYNGVGVNESKNEGLEYIKLSAGRLYALAIEFLIQHYKDDKSESGLKNLHLYRRMWKWME
jgi:TPR repeat protein